MSNKDINDFLIEFERIWKSKINSLRNDATIELGDRLRIYRQSGVWDLLYEEEHHTFQVQWHRKQYDGSASDRPLSDPNKLVLEFIKYIVETGENHGRVEDRELGLWYQWNYLTFS